jgi:hypothetical protein
VSASLAVPSGRDEERLSETQERFLRAAATRLPLERVVELHLFPPLRQGGMETGFAVIAAKREPTAPPAAPPAAPDDAATTEDAPADAPPVDQRLVVFSARYRLTLKGPERGRWEVEVVEEADAPLVTVDAVVRGMQRRIGEGAEPERLTAEQLHLLLDEPPGATTAG